MKQRKAVFVSDIHAPYHDPKAILAVVDFIKWFKPDDIIFMGDVIDFYALSSFNKDPERALRLQTEIDTANEVIDQIRKAQPKASVFLIRGNHEARLQRFLWKKAPELSGLSGLNVETLLKLKERKITYFEKGRMTYHGIIVKHGDIVRKFAGYSAKAEMEDEGMSGISAHTHRIGMADRNTAGGRIKWIECGCLCDMEQEYLEGRTPNWATGIAIGYFYENSKKYNILPLEIIDGKLLILGDQFPKDGK